MRNISEELRPHSRGGGTDLPVTQIVIWVCDSAAKWLQGAWRLNRDCGVMSWRAQRLHLATAVHCNMLHVSSISSSFILSPHNICYGCETWSRTLRVFQNRPQDDVCKHYTILRGNSLTLGPKMEEVTVVCKKNCLTRGPTTCTAEYWEGDQIREDHMGGRAKCIQRFGGESWEKREAWKT